MTETAENKTAPVTAPFEIKIAGDGLSVLLSLDRSILQNGNWHGLVEEKMKEMGILSPPDWERADAVINESGQDRIVDIVVASGIPPVPSEDGRLEWTDDYFTAGYYVDPVTKRTDFHQKVEKTSVEKGQLLVRMIPSRPGKDGQDVYGLPIKVSRPHNIELRSGPNVLWDATENGYRAKTSGKVRLSGKILDVDEVFYVAGDIGLETGNIKHTGQIAVNGNIEANFKVEATGGVDVHGMLFASDINCGGNLTAREGINENNTKRVIVGGNTVAKYILNGVVECGGNVVVGTEIFQSFIKCCGEVRCDGRIVGGEIVSGQGITVNEAGSKANVKTTLVAGVNFTLMEKLKKNNEDIIGLKETIKKLSPILKKLKAGMAALTAAQKEGLMEIEFKITEADEEINSLEEQNKNIRKEIFANKDAYITILGTVYPGVTLRIFDSQYTVENALLGPIEARLDRMTAEIALSSELENRTEQT
ncbi:hypothetical protein TRIP_C90018 [Candidatus Zixiibacteriota bacterium]|nr:hypothetical protein TRIP_C90018 [candidate division Zixibacteria bacterium]